MGRNGTLRPLNTDRGTLVVQIKALRRGKLAQGTRTQRGNEGLSSSPLLQTGLARRVNETYGVALQEYPADGLLCRRVCLDVMFVGIR